MNHTLEEVRSGSVPDAVVLHKTYPRELLEGCNTVDMDQCFYSLPGRRSPLVIDNAVLRELFNAAAKEIRMLRNRCGNTE